MANKTSDAQIRASQKYNSKATKTILIRLNIEKDKDIIDHLDKQKSMMGYIKKLIRNDMDGKITMEVKGIPLILPRK